MDPLFHTRDKGTIKTMDFIEWTSSEEGEDRKVGRKSHSFLGCMRYNSYRLPSVKANDQWRLLRGLIGPFQQHFKEKTSLFGEEESALQDNARVHTRHRWQIQWIPLRIVSPSSIFIRFNSLRLNYFLFPNLKKWFGEKRFTTREQLIAETEAYFKGLDKSYYSDGFYNYHPNVWKFW